MNHEFIISRLPDARGNQSSHLAWSLVTGTHQGWYQVPGWATLYWAPTLVEVPGNLVPALWRAGEESRCRKWKSSVDNDLFRPILPVWTYLSCSLRTHLWGGTIPILVACLGVRPSSTLRQKWKYCLGLSKSPGGTKHFRKLNDMITFELFKLVDEIAQTNIDSLSNSLNIVINILHRLMYIYPKYSQCSYMAAYQILLMS